MYDARWIRDNAALFDEGRRRRGLEPLSAQILALDDRRRAAIAAAQAAQERRNAASKEIGAAMKAQDAARADALKTEVAELKTSLPTLEAEETAAAEALDEMLAGIPNQPLDDVPEGKDEDGNVLKSEWGRRPSFSFKPKEHFELGEALGLMDFETAAKLSGARFVVNKGPLARLERALAQFMLDLHTGEHGYTEVNPPILVREDAMLGTAQLPKFREDQFAAVSSFLPIDDPNTILNTKRGIAALKKAQSDFDLVNTNYNNLIRQSSLEISTPQIDSLLRMKNIFDNLNREMSKPTMAAFEGLEKLTEHFARKLWLIPTAEVPLTNLVRETILDEATLPLRFTAATPCFRAEAGAAGRDTRGMIRQHQFTKVELVSITTPEQSAEEHARMLGCAEAVLQKLELPYRVMTLCTGDMGFASRKTYDIEVWLPGQDRYREISSCSVCGDFQARRMNARCRPAGAKSPRFVHTLNGSGVAVGRALIAVMENYQEADGAIRLPEALKPYMGGIERIGRSS